MIVLNIEDDDDGATGVFLNIIDEAELPVEANAEFSFAVATESLDM